jgi:hypothetical protein
MLYELYNDNGVAAMDEQPSHDGKAGSCNPKHPRAMAIARWSFRTYEQTYKALAESKQQQ